MKNKLCYYQHHADLGDECFSDNLALYLCKSWLQMIDSVTLQRNLLTRRLPNHFVSVGRNALNF